LSRSLRSRCWRGLPGVTSDYCDLEAPCHAAVLLRWAQAPATERQGESKLPHYGLVAEQPREVWDLATHARQPGMVPRCAP
jgi:hypothetical protein